MADGISPKLPLSADPIDGVKMNKTQRAAVKQNFRNLLLTSPGERIFYPNFGCGLYDVLFEINSDQAIADLGSRIVDQVSRWMSYIEIESLDIDTQDGTILRVNISYFIAPLGIQDNIIINSEEFNGE